MAWGSTLAALYFRCQDLHCYNVHTDLTEKRSQAQNNIFLVLETLPEQKQYVNRRPNKTEGLGQGNQKLYAHLQQHVDKVRNWQCYSLCFFTSSSKFSQAITLNCPWNTILWPFTITLRREVEGEAREFLIPSHIIHFLPVNTLYFPKTLPRAVSFTILPLLFPTRTMESPYCFFTYFQLKSHLPILTPKSHALLNKFMLFSNRLLGWVLSDRVWSIWGKSPFWILLENSLVCRKKVAACAAVSWCYLYCP